jgi:hypothetical protein
MAFLVPTLDFFFFFFFFFVAPDYVITGDRDKTHILSCYIPAFKHACIVYRFLDFWFADLSWVVSGMYIHQTTRSAVVYLSEILAFKFRSGEKMVCGRTHVLC